MHDINVNQLLGVTYSEFDNTVGPQLLYEYPKGAISLDDFEAVSEYVIVGKHLCEKIIMIKLGDIKFLNFSVAVENSKYERNTLSFALGFVFEKDSVTEPYESILRKISATFIAMELENEFLFNPLSKKQLSTVLLQNIYDGLRTTGEVFMQLDGANLLSARLLRPPLPPQVIQACDVPLLIQSSEAISVMPWDITVLRIVHHIDGKKSVHRIADEANIDIDCVRRCIRVLLFYECLLLTDVFLFSNMYRTIAAVLDFHSHPPQHLVDAFNMMGSDLSELQRENIYRFILSIRSGVPIGTTIADNLALVRGLDLPRIFAVALHTGVIERIRGFPLVKVSEAAASSSKAHDGDKNMDDMSNLSELKKGISNKKSRIVNTKSASGKATERIAASSPYACGCSLDEIMCNRRVLMLSNKEIEGLQSGPMIFK